MAVIVMPRIPSTQTIDDPYQDISFTKYNILEGIKETEEKDSDAENMSSIKYKGTHTMLALVMMQMN
jgi:hypothetical protein